MCVEQEFFSTNLEMIAFWVGTTRNNWFWATMHDNIRCTVNLRNFPNAFMPHPNLMWQFFFCTYSCLFLFCSLFSSFHSVLSAFLFVQSLWILFRHRVFRINFLFYSSFIISSERHRSDESMKAADKHSHSRSYFILLFFFLFLVRWPAFIFPLSNEKYINLIWTSFILGPKCSDRRKNRFSTIRNQISGKNTSICMDYVAS